MVVYFANNNSELWILQCNFCCSYYSTKAVFLALGITVVVTVAVTVFCFQTKVGYTYNLYTISMTLCHCVNVGYHAFLFFYRWISLNVQVFFCVLGIVVFVTGIITTIVLSFKYVSMTLHLVFTQKLLFDHLRDFFTVSDPMASHALCSNRGHCIHSGMCTHCITFNSPFLGILQLCMG